MAKDIKTYELEDGGLFFAPNEEQTEYANGGYKYTPPVSKNTMSSDNVPNSNRPVSKPGSGKPVSSKDFIERGLAAASLGLPFPYSYGASILGSGIDFYDAYNEKDPNVRNALLIEGTLGLIPYGKAAKGIKLSKTKEFNLKNADAVLNVKDLIYPDNDIYKSTVKPAPVIIEKKPTTNYSKKTYDIYHSKDNKTLTIDGKKMTKEQFNNDFFKSHPGANYVNHIFEHGGIYFEEGGTNQFDFVRNQSPNVPTNFEQRMYHTPYIDNEDGSMSSHKMMSWSDENGEHSAPTIVYQNGKLVELTPDEAIDYAYKNGEMKTFNSFEESYDYGNNGYKQNTPMEVFAPNPEFEPNALYGGRNAYANGGYTVTRSSDRKGKTHKVTGPDGTVKYFGDSNLGQHPKDEKRKAAFYARHKSNLAGNPYFRAFARKTWEEGGEINSNEDIPFLPSEFLEDADVLAYGGMIKRADGSYSQRGLWDNIRANKGSGKKPTNEMLRQEKKIKSQYENGGVIETEDGGLFFEF